MSSGWHYVVAVLPLAFSEAACQVAFCHIRLVFGQLLQRQLSCDLKCMSAPVYYCLPFEVFGLENARMAYVPLMQQQQHCLRLELYWVPFKYLAVLQFSYLGTELARCYGLLHL